MGLKAGDPGSLTKASAEGRGRFPGEKSPGLLARPAPCTGLLGLKRGLHSRVSLCPQQVASPLCSASPGCALSSHRLPVNAEIPGLGGSPLPPPSPLLPSLWPREPTPSLFGGHSPPPLFSPADVALYGGREARERPEGGGDRQPLVWNHGVLTLEVRVWERRAPLPGEEPGEGDPCPPCCLPLLPRSPPPTPKAPLPGPPCENTLQRRRFEIRFQTRGDGLCFQRFPPI